MYYITMSINSLWYLVIGFLLGNGMPHFIFGVAGKMFRTPFGRDSSPRRNVLWGLGNFILATLLVLWQTSVQSVQRVDLILLLAGFSLAAGMFGITIKSFLSDKERH